MTIRTKANFENMYLTSSETWPDNIIGDITPGDLRDGIQDFLDSQISNWPLDVYPTVTTIRITNGNSPYTSPASGEVFFCNTNAGAIYVNMASGVEGNYQKYINCGISGSLLTISGYGSQTVYGAASQILNNGDVIELHYNTVEGWW